MSFNDKYSHTLYDDLTPWKNVLITLFILIVWTPGNLNKILFYKFNGKKYILQKKKYYVDCL